MSAEPPAADQGRQGRQISAIDQRQDFIHLVQARIVRNGLEFSDQFPQNPFQERGVKDGGRLRKAPQGRARHAQEPLDLLQDAGPLNAPERLADGVEHRQHYQGHVLVHVKGAVACAVALATGLVEAVQEAGDLLEILEPLEFILTDF